MKAIHAAVAVLTISGCASLQVRTDSNPQASFGQLTTYDWTTQTVHASGHPAVNSPLVEQRIRQAVDSTLRHMGYQRVTSGTPDFRVSYRIVAERKTRVDPGYGYGGYGYGSSYGRGYFGRGYGGYGYGGYGYGSSYRRGYRSRGYGGYGYGSSYRRGYRSRGYGGYGYRGLGYGPYYGASGVGEYLEARLVLDVVDARTNELIWRGWATDDLDGNPHAEAVQQYIEEAVEQILERFPQASSGRRPGLVAP